MNNPDILSVGNAMRMKRNRDLYDGGVVMSEKETDDYLEFIAGIVRAVEERLASVDRD